MKDRDLDQNSNQLGTENVKKNINKSFNDDLQESYNENLNEGDALKEDFNEHLNRSVNQEKNVKANQEKDEDMTKVHQPKDDRGGNLEFPQEYEEHVNEALRMEEQPLEKPKEESGL